jgi:LPPG:FO 2-phospho-L-lactate transferase
MTDDFTPTWVYTIEGEMPFQEYFVHRQCQPIVTGYHFQGAEDASPAPGVLDAIHNADLVVFCPSNPWVSLDPILSIPGIRAAVSARPVAAVSPIIGGQTVKGPAAKMFAELGIPPTAAAVARHYAELLCGFVIDQVDCGLEAEIQQLEMRTCVTNAIMRTPLDRARLAKEVIDFGIECIG